MGELAQLSILDYIVAISTIIMSLGEVYFYGINMCFFMIANITTALLGCVTFVKFFNSLQISTANRVCTAKSITYIYGVSINPFIYLVFQFSIIILGTTL